MNSKTELEFTNLYLRRHVVFKGLPENTLDEIALVAKQHLLKKGATIGITGLHPNRVYFLISGKLKTLAYSKNEWQPVKEVIYPNEMFGNISLNGFEGAEQAVALTHNTLVYCISIKDFKTFIHRHHQLAINYADNLSGKLLQLKEKHSIWANHDARTKLSFFLKKWVAAEGVFNDNVVVVQNFLSLSDIADILSVSRQFMYTLLDELKKQELLFYSRHEIVINPSLFKEFVAD